MLLNLKSINESFAQKYGLNEAFDESMPKWLRDRLGFESTFTNRKGPRPWDARDKATKKYPGNIMPDYQENRSTGESGEDLSLLKQMLKAGIDISKVKVTEAPIPDKIPRNTKNNTIIPIFHFKNGQVWAKGINDREKAFWKDLPFRSMKNEDILSAADAYAYIDLNDENINTVTEIREKRKELRQQLNEIPNYERRLTELTNSWLKLDKSGYDTTANKGRYKEKIKELKASKIGQMFIDTNDKIQEYKQILSDAILDTESSQDIERAYRATSYLYDIKREMDNITTYLAEIEKVTDKSLADRYTASVLDRFDNCNKRFKDIDEKIDGFAKVAIDW